MTVPNEKNRLISETEHEVINIERQYKRGFITEDERYRLVVSEWESTTKKVTDALQGTLNEYNPIYMMANSGARGSMNQIRQLAGMRGWSTSSPPVAPERAWPIRRFVPPTPVT